MEIPEDARAILERPLLGVLSTTRPDGSPHSVPVWFRFDGEKVNIWTGEDFRWGRYARARPQVALTVCDSGDRFSGAVVLRGLVSFATGNFEFIIDERRRIAARYLESEAVDPYLERFAHLRTIATIEPTSIAAWASAE